MGTTRTALQLNSCFTRQLHSYTDPQLHKAVPAATQATQSSSCSSTSFTSYTRPAPHLLLRHVSCSRVQSPSILKICPPSAFLFQFSQVCPRKCTVHRRSAW